jgi:hypothetical protein
MIVTIVRLGGFAVVIDSDVLFRSQWIIRVFRSTNKWIYNSPHIPLPMVMCFEGATDSCSGCRTECEMGTYLDYISHIEPSSEVIAVCYDVSVGPDSRDEDLGMDLS